MVDLAGLMQQLTGLLKPLYPDFELVVVEWYNPVQLVQDYLANHRRKIVVTVKAVESRANRFLQEVPFKRRVQLEVGVWINNAPYHVKLPKNVLRHEIVAHLQQYFRNNPLFGMEVSVKNFDTTSDQRQTWILNTVLLVEKIEYP